MGWTDDTVKGNLPADLPPTAYEINHSMGDRGESIDYHDDGNGFTRTDTSGNKHGYRDSNNAKGHDHYINGTKVSK